MRSHLVSHKSAAAAAIGYTLSRVLQGMEDAEAQREAAVSIMMEASADTPRSNSFRATAARRILNNAIFYLRHGVVISVARYSRQLPLSFATVRDELKKRDISIRRTTTAGEFRVNFNPGVETTAYYTEDLIDAFETGIAIAQQRDEWKNTPKVRA